MVLLVGSVPYYAFGRFDPTPEIAKLANFLGIGCYSYCCLGNSISCDPHYYCYGPIGLLMLSLLIFVVNNKC